MRRHRDRNRSDDGVPTMLPFRIPGEIADKRSRIYELRAERDEKGRLRIIHNLKQRDQVPEWSDPEVRIY